MIVLALTQDAILFVFLNFVECDQCITAFILNRLCKDAILIVSTKGVHEDMRLGRGHMDAATAALDFATLDLGVVALGDLDAGAEHALDDDALHDLLGALALQVNAHDLAVRDLAVLNLDCIVRVGQAIDCTRLEVIKRCIRDEDI